MNQPRPFTIEPPRLGLGARARAILDDLPQWFGIPEANEEYIAFVETHPTWSAVAPDGTVVGVLAPQMHGPESAEIHLIAVLHSSHRGGVGRALVDAYERTAIADGVRLSQVKTLGPSDPDPGYALTRQFYASLGYLPLEEMLDLWPDTPALLMVKALVGPTGEAGVIAHSEEPITGEMIQAALRAAGVRHGGVAIAHSSMSRLGFIAGDSPTILHALRSVIGPTGTLVMPAQTGMSDPATWVNPPVPDSWWQTIRDNTQPYDPMVTPLRDMGRVVDAFRNLTGTVCSGHPAVAFVASGPLATQIVASHPLSNAFDDDSPLGRLYELEAQIVLLGVGHDNNTSLHLAEHRAAYSGKAWTTMGASTLVDGERRWITYEDLHRDESDFPAIGVAFAAATGGEQRVSLGNGEVIVCSMRQIVDFAVTWLEANRQAG